MARSKPESPSASGAGAPTPSSPAAAPRLDKWIILGPGGGGAQFFPRVSPHDPKDVLNSTDMSEAYVSRDGGDSWRQCDVRGHTRFIVWDPIDPKTAYIKTLALFRTTDGAKTWRLVHPDASRVERIAAIGDHGFERIFTKDGGTDEIIAMAIDPADSKTLFAMMSTGGGYVMARDGKYDFRVSTDWGKTWTIDPSFPEGAKPVFPDGFARIWVDPASPRSDRAIYVVGGGSVLVREGGKWSIRKGPEGVKSFNEASMGFPKGGRPVIYAASGAGWRGDEGNVAGIHLSEDGAATWKRIDAGISALVPRGSEGVNYQTVATCPARPDVAYVSYKGPLVNPDDKRVRFAGVGERYAGVAKTTDRGKTWDLVWADSDKPSPNVKNDWMNERFSPEWGGNPFHINVAATNPDIAFATDFGRTVRTTDGGKTWFGVDSKRMPDDSWTTRGLDMTTCYGVHWDPFDNSRVFIDYTDIGLFVSENGGTSWKSATVHGVPEAWVNTCYWMVFDPEVKGRCWAVMSGVHDLPFPKMWQRTGIGHYMGGVVASSDSGRTWRKSSDGMPETAATDIIMDPTSPKGARVLYVAGLGTGFWKSIDDGKTWTLKNNGIVGKEPFAWRIVMDQNGTLYGVVARRSWDGSYGNEYDGALYRSTDGAETWQRIALPDRVTGPHGICIDPRDATRLYLAVWGLKNDNGDTHGGILLSTDAGKSWRWVFDKHKHVYDVIADPHDPNVYYAGTMTFSVWRSTDRGETWSRIKGYNFKQVNRIVPDPFHKGMIYVTTFGGSVWYGPAAGDPDAPEDVATPEMAY